MRTAQIIYEQYKVLPKKIKEELKTLIIEEDSNDTVEVHLKGIEKGLKEVKLIREGKLQARPISELLKELGHE